MLNKREEANNKLINSAKYIKDRVDPLDCLSGLEVSRKETKLNLFLIWLKSLKEKRLEKKEFYRIKNLSAIAKKEEAFREYSKYYKYLYISKSPDHEKLKDLILKYDIPNQKNPYNKSTLEYAFFHDSGFLGAEIQAILIYSKEKRNINIDPKENVDLYKITNEEFYLNKVNETAKHAMLSLAYMIYYGENVHNIYSSEISRDRIVFSIIETFLSLDFSELPFSKNDFREKILQESLIIESDINVEMIHFLIIETFISLGNERSLLSKEEFKKKLLEDSMINEEVLSLVKFTKKTGK